MAIAKTILVCFSFGTILATAQPPGQGSASARQATQLLRDGKASEAEALVRAELANNPDSPQANNAMGTLLDLEGKSAEAKRYFAKAIEKAPDAAAKAQAQRAMAMSYAFDNNCANAAKYERMVAEYWAGEKNLYQQGEMLTEAGRVCIEAGKFEEAEKLYKAGYDIGVQEPARVSLWNFRWEHAQARLAARRGNAPDATRHAAAAKTVLDADVEMAKQQAVFYPYLMGYIALYTGDGKKALEELQQANTNDPFIQCLIGQAYEKSGDKDKAIEMYRKASMTVAHNPPAAYAKWFTREKLK